MDPERKALQHGVSTLTDSELLGLLLRTGTPEKSAVGIAAEILAIGNGQFHNLYRLTLKQLMAIPGIGKVKALQLKTVAELAKRINAEPLREKIRFDDAASVADYFMVRMRREPQEVVVVALFDAHGEFMEDEMISRGTISHAVFSPREIFSYAIRGMASFIIILHNHPSGDPTPSEADIESTKKLELCSEFLGIGLLDHIIIGDHVYYSFLNEGKLGRGNAAAAGKAHRTAPVAARNDLGTD